MKTVKNYSPKMKILSLILSFLIIFYLIPSSVFAEGLTGDTSGFDSSVSDNKESNTYTPEIYEVTELREENVKHFRLEDGSYVAAQYNYPVHYTDENGEFEDIDNRLVESGTEFSTNNSRVKFIKKITGNGNIFTLHENNTKITMGLVGAEKKTKGVVTDTESSDDKIEDTLGKMINLENLSSTILYENILDGVDIEYVVHSFNIKENIIVKERKNSYSYTFTIELNNLSATLSEDGNVYITSADGETRYVIPAPIVYDAAENYAPKSASSYTLSTVGNKKYELNVTVDDSWMNANDRYFPVTIDPTIGVLHEYMVDTDISSTNPDISYGDENYLNVSQNWRSYWRIPTQHLPSLPSTAYIWKAELKLMGRGLDAYVGAYEITSDWDETLTWNKTLSAAPEGAFGNQLIDYRKLGADDAWYAFDLTKLAERWYNGEDNFGVGFKLVDGTDISKSAEFYSYEYCGSVNIDSVDPSFYVYYSDIGGLEDYYSLSSHSAAGVASGTVNLATGNLTLISNLVSTTDYLLPMTLSAVYNSDMSGKDYNVANSFSAYSSSFMPYGFKLNISETIVELFMLDENGAATSYCILNDADGTNHYFYSTLEDGYVDDSGQGRTLTQLSTGEIEITYKDQSKKLFTKMSQSPDGTNGGWVLSKITDSTGNSVVITLDASYRPTMLSLLPAGQTTEINMLSFTYNMMKLARIQNLNNLNYTALDYSATYNYSGLSLEKNYLKKITYGNSNVTSLYTEVVFSYYSNGNIKSINNSQTAENISYSYSGGKLSMISEYACGDLGQQVSYTYGEGFADVRSTGNNEILNDDDDIVTRYVYDIYGRTVSAYSGTVGFTKIHGATMAIYETAQNVKNNLKETSVVYDCNADYLEEEGENIYVSLNGGIDKTEETGCYKITVFEEENPEDVLYTNANKQFVISGFGYSNSIISNPNARFSISAKVYYYQGEGEEDVIVTHNYDFLDVENTWQFVSAKLDCKLSNESSSIFDVVRKIELVCYYYGQITSDGQYPSANFKDLTFTDFSDSLTYRYSYDEDTGNLVMKSNYSYREYYEYNDKNSVTRIANSKGQIYDYHYDTDGVTLLYESYYSFNRIGSFPGNLLYDYPFGEENIESKIQKTLITRTAYTYTDQGQLASYSHYGETTSVGGVFSASYVYEQSPGSPIFGALLSETGNLGSETKYFYDESSGELLAQIDVESGSGFVYSYDDFGTLVGVIPATGSETSYSGVSNAESVSYQYDSTTHRLSKIITETTEYAFTYDSFGNSASVTAGNTTLATYEYSNNNGKISKINYGNGFSEEYSYNNLELLSEIWYNYSNGTRRKAYSYSYNADGSLALLTNHLDGTSIEYIYDVHGRFVSSSESSVSNTNYSNKFEVKSYDADGRVETTANSLSYLSASGWSNAVINNRYSYNSDGTLKNESVYSGSSVTSIIDYYYDRFNRTTRTVRRIDGFRYETNYDYYLNNGQTSVLVSEITNTINETSTTYNYTYDNKGNIIKIVRGNQEIRYTYDDLGQLLVEENEVLNQRFTYTYDNSGNILTKKTENLTTGESNTVAYAYAGSGLGDRLVTYDGKGFSYTGLGNPFSYYNGTNYRFGWTGRNLVYAQKDGGITMSFIYNESGIRTSKTVNGNTTTYYLNGTRIVAEETENYLMVYLYDSYGSPIGMMYRESTYGEDQWEVSWFEKNLQGDIVGVYDNDGNLIVKYEYDAWGNFVETQVSNSHGAFRNPFRYRGYYYDVDLGMYYLQSRYYDSKICRFINADGVMANVGGNILGNNLYAYCFNNPVNLVDSSGSWPKWVTDTIDWVEENIVNPIVSGFTDLVGEIKACKTSTDNPKDVLAADFVANYKDTIVIKVPGYFGLSFGVVFLGNDPAICEADVQHEFGHTRQLNKMGLLKYTTQVALPSVTAHILTSSGKLPYDYYSSPWESEADKYGKVDLTTAPYRTFADPWTPSDGYFWDLIKLF